MDTSGERPVSPTGERLHAELRRLDWAKGLSEETFAAITNTAEWVEFRAGDVVIEVESEDYPCVLPHHGPDAGNALRFAGQGDSEGYSCPRVCHWIVCPRFIGSLSLASPGY